MKNFFWLLVIGYQLLVTSLFAQEKPFKVNFQGEPSFQKGLLLANTGQYQLAIDELLKVVELEPKHTTAYFLLGVCLTEVGKYDEAILFLEKVRDNFSQSEVLHYTLALLYEKKEKWNEAYVSWQKVNILTRSKEIKEMSRKHLKQIEEYLK
jgi:tetratricopeptide (TPR) repeat protein